MGKLIYLMTTSLDGYAADSNGNFDWGMPTEEIHSFINDQLRNVGTVLMGRKLYETMKIWDDIPTEGTSGPMDGPSPAMNDYSKIWQAANKIVYSSTVDNVTIANTTIEREFNPTKVQQQVAGSDKDYDLGGPQLAAAAIKANIIDDYHQFIVPIILGNGLHWLQAGANNKLELVDMRQFDNGTIYLHYRKKP